MVERIISHEQTHQNYLIDVYTPETIAGQEFDGHIQDALSRVRESVNELQGINYVTTTRNAIAEYTMAVPDSPQREKGGFQHEWDSQLQQGDYKPVSEGGRNPFLLIASTTYAGVVGAAAGRMYTFKGTGEPAIFIEWVGVKNTGINDGDTSSKGQGAGRAMYAKVEQLARANNIKLIIAGVHAQNEGSQVFHDRMGFHLEQSPDGSERTQATTNGVYMAPYRERKNTPLRKEIRYYSKRLP